MADSQLGESVHAKTVQSYRDLGLEVPDSVRLATLRPGERMKYHMSVNSKTS